MGKFIGFCLGLFVVAVGFVILTEAAQIGALIATFHSQSVLRQVAWAVIVLVPLVMLPFAVWMRETLVRQRQTAKALELRLDGVRQSAGELTELQAEIDGTVQHLTLTDPEDAISALKRRVTEAERFAEIQRRRHEDKDLTTRVDEVRTQQKELKERLAPVLDTRRALEQLFLELDSRQNDIDRALAEIASGDDAIALDLRLIRLTEFVRRGNARCDQVENASKTIRQLNEACADLRLRLAPFAAVEDGITSRVRDLTGKIDQLVVNMDALERTPDGPLADCVQKLDEEKKKLEEEILRLDGQYCKLANLRKDIGGLFIGFDRALNAVSINGANGHAAGIDTRVEELARFIEQTHVQIDDVERRLVVFGQFKARLDELNARLAPLESEETGVVRLIEELHDVRDRLVVKIRRIEGGEEGDLAARIKVFADSKRELEERVSSLADQFVRLATVRKDIAGLFDKLSSAVNSSSG